MLRFIRGERQPFGKTNHQCLADEWNVPNSQYSIVVSPQPNNSGFATSEDHSSQQQHIKFKAANVIAKSGTL